MLSIVRHEGHHGVHALLSGLCLLEVIVVIACHGSVYRGHGYLVVVGLELVGGICVDLRVHAELLTKLSDLILDLVERRQCILGLTAGNARVGEVIYKLLILSFKLLERLLHGIGILTAVIEPVELINCLLYGVLQIGQQGIDLLIYESKVIFCALKIGNLLGNIYPLVAEQVDGVINGAVGIVQRADERIVRSDKLIDGIVILRKVPVNLGKRIFEHADGVVALNALGEGIELVKQRLDNGLYVRFVDQLFYIVARRLDDLDGDGIRFLVLIEIDGGAKHVLV